MEAYYYLGAAAAYVAAAAGFVAYGKGALSRVAALYFLIDAFHAAAHGAPGLTSDPRLGQALLNTLHLPSYAGFLVGALFFSRFAGVHDKFWWKPATIASFLLVPIALILFEFNSAAPYYTFSSDGAHAFEGTDARWMGVFGFWSLVFDVYFIGLAAMALARCTRASQGAAPALLLAFAIIREAPVAIEYGTLPARWDWLSAFSLPTPPLLPVGSVLELAGGLLFVVAPLIIVHRSTNARVRDMGHAAIGLAAIVVGVVAIGAGTSVAISNVRVFFGILVLAYAAFRHGLLGARQVGRPGIEGSGAVLAFALLLIFTVATLANILPGWVALTGGLAAAPLATALLLSVSGLSVGDAVRIDGRPRDAFAPGSRLLRRYRIVRHLDDDEPANVALAHDTVEDREVVLRRLPAGSVDYAATKRAAAALAGVNHPHVVRLFEVEETPDGLILVFEYADGGALSETLTRSGPLPPAVFDRTARGLLAGLSAVHASGLVHRDVKPASVLLTRAGDAKLADLDVARSPDVDATLGVGRLTPSLVSTLRYMSPEQARGSTVTSASDVFAAGLTLYEARTGVSLLPVRSGDTTVDVLQRAMRGVTLPEGWTDPLAPWFRMALAHDPQARFPTAGHALAALEAVSPSLAPSAAVGAPVASARPHFEGQGRAGPG